GVLIVTPEACWLPDEIESGRRLFGVAAQLYLLRSGRNWGIGDFADLDRLVAIAADRGADIVGLNPLHALFMDDPEAASPYSPASRLLLNPLSIAIDRLPPGPRLDAYRRSPEVRARIEAARATAHVDYTAVVALKSEALRRAYADFRETADEARRRALDDFVAAQGEGFRRGCLFLALRESFAQDKPPRPDWRTWPEDYRGPDGVGVMRFMEDAPEAIDYQRYLQFVADEQLAAATADARARGMAVGLYRDLAVGADSTGAETWSGPEAVVRGVSVGAPPDIFMPIGQSWGLPPFHPRALQEEAYASFVELVRANMRHAGGLRIDHVMGLQHLWWVPDGMSPADGAYVEYPLDDLVGIIALESHRNRCLVIGEDLGTVSDGFRERMADAGILSYRVLFFEQDFNTGAFRPASSYPAKAMAVCGSHDLPTLRGWWLGVDNDLKERLGLFPGHDETAAQRARRDRDRDTFVALLRADGLLPAEGEVDEAAFVQAATAFLAETSSAIAMVQLDDITGEVQPVNVPTTHREYPNWRRKYRATLEEIGRDDAAWACVRPLAGR
ncbi:MAG TPA: 4-alpha-glucanotransferase, partial [Methylomirabilota bacterium]|nr:4-alpha-glucanotransferase [Methylomirabilota bacterium]